MSKVLYLIDTLQTGGAERSLLEISSRLKKYKPFFFQLFPGDDLLEDFKKKGIGVKQFGLRPGYNFKRYARRILPEVIALQPDIIHSTLFRADMVGRSLGKLTDLPLVNSFVNNTYGRARYTKLAPVGKLKLAGIQFWDKLTTSSVDLFISNSKSIKDANIKALDISPNRVEVVHRGRNANDFTSVSASETMQRRESMGLFDKYVFLNVSRLLDRKGQLDLIKAFHQVHQQFPDSVLLIAGEGSFRTILENEISKLGLQHSVKLLGDRKDIPQLLSLADYFVFPSYYEGLPGAIIEAMLSRTPIVASAIPENLECIDATMALLFEPGDVEALATQMEKAIEYKHWHQRTEKAFNYAIEQFEISKIASQYEAVYDRLLKT